MSENIMIIGAGPAGLACAHELARAGIAALVIDRNSEAGGLLRTLVRDDFLFDIGGHRFLSKSDEVNDLWKEILGEDLLRVKRRSRILYRKKYFEYPLKISNVLKELGPLETLRSLASYLASRTFASCDGKNFEGWMIKRFGRRLYETFFKTYTEKVWGIPCCEISSDWASQRMQGLSLGQAVLRALFPGGEPRFKTLSDEFLYPVLGPGMFCEKLKERTESKGTRYLLETDVKEVHYHGDRVTQLVVQTRDEPEKVIRGDMFFSCIPLSLLVWKLRPSIPEAVLSAAAMLKFRSFVSVYLIVDAESLFPDNWIYLHSPEVKAARIQNYKNWSSRMVPDPTKTSLGVEYFVTEGDDIWNLGNAELIDLAAGELQRLGLVSSKALVSGFVARVPNAYPVYSPGYQGAVARIRSFLSSFRNLRVMGRAGLFRYNNSDHALLTGICAARNSMGAGYDLWSLDIDGAE